MPWPASVLGNPLMPSLLVIDDDRTVLLLVKRAFKDSDLVIHAAHNASEGMEMLREHKPDVLLLDIMLPEISGIELAKEIRAVRHPRLPVIFITATNDSDTAIEAMKQGAYDYLLKPLDVQQVEVAGRAGAGNAPADELSGAAQGVGNGRRRRRPAGRSQPQDAGGVQADRPRRGAGRHRAHPRRERLGQGTDRAGPLPAQPPSRATASWRSTARP